MGEVLKKITLNRSKPVNINPEDNFLFKDEYVKVLKKSKVKILRNIYVDESKLKKFKYFRIYAKHWRMNPLSFKDKISYLTEDVIHFFKNKKQTHINFISKASWVLDSRSFQYFHWFTDALQRIEVSKKYHHKYPVLLLPGFENIRYIIDTLDLLNIDYIVLEKKQTYFIKELVLAERVSPAGNYRKEVIKAISSSLSLERENSSKDNIHERIWVSRQSADKRRIVNFDEIKKILEEYKFKIINFEDNYLKENIHIMRNCKILGGIHGAGLTNMMFMNKNASVIEVRAEGDNKNNCYFSLASDLDKNYFYFFAKPSTQNFYNADYYIDPVMFDNFLKENIF